MSIAPVNNLLGYCSSLLVSRAVYSCVCMEAGGGGGEGGGGGYLAKGLIATFYTLPHIEK